MSVGQACLLLFAAMNVARAQVVSGHVTEADGRTPVPGAIVSLVQGDQKRIAPVLSSEDGSFTTRAPAAGAYRVRADAVGLGTTGSDVIPLSAGDTVHVVLVLSARSGTLDAIRVVGETTCHVDPAQGERTAAVWQEIRTALEVSAATERERGTPLSLTIDDAVGGVRGGRRSSSRVTLRSFTGAGFHTAPPAELASRGYVRETGDSITYFAPDATALTSSEFLATHCFSVVERRPFFGKRELGLAFTPLPDRKLADVSGTLWLDRTTSALKRLELDYVIPGRPAGLPGGRAEVEYARLPTGRWFVSRWSLLMPITQLFPPVRGSSVERVLVSGYRERIGEARPLSAKEAAAAPTPAILIGLAFDSTLGVPLGGATVRFKSAASVATDAEGRFGFKIEDPQSVPTPHIVRLWHPRLAALGLDTLERAFTLAPGDSVDATVAIPSVATLTPKLCPVSLDTAPRPSDAGRGIVIGRVLKGDSITPAVNVEVEATWWVNERGVPVPSDGRQRRGSAVQTGSGGRYAFCGLPLGVPIMLKASLVPGKSSERVEVTLAEEWLGEETLVLPPG